MMQRGPGLFDAANQCWGLNFLNRPGEHMGCRGVPRPGKQAVFTFLIVWSPRTTYRCLLTKVVHLYLAPSILGLWFSGIGGHRTSSKQRAAFVSTLVVVMHHIGGSQLTRFEPESSKCWGWPTCQLIQLTCAWSLQIVIQLSNCSNLTTVLNI